HGEDGLDGPRRLGQELRGQVQLARRAGVDLRRVGLEPSESARVRVRVYDERPRPGVVVDTRDDVLLEPVLDEVRPDRPLDGRREGGRLGRDLAGPDEAHRPELVVLDVPRGAGAARAGHEDAHDEADPPRRGEGDVGRHRHGRREGVALGHVDGPAEGEARLPLEEPLHGRVVGAGAGHLEVEVEDVAGHLLDEVVHAHLGASRGVRKKVGQLRVGEETGEQRPQKGIRNKRSHPNLLVVRGADVVPRRPLEVQPVPALSEPVLPLRLDDGARREEAGGRDGPVPRHALRDAAQRAARLKGGKTQLAERHLQADEVPWHAYLEEAPELGAREVPRDRHESVLRQDVERTRTEPPRPLVLHDVARDETPPAPEDAALEVVPYPRRGRREAPLADAGGAGRAAGRGGGPGRGAARRSPTWNGTRRTRRCSTSRGLGSEMRTEREPGSVFGVGEGVVFAQPKMVEINSDPGVTARFLKNVRREEVKDLHRAPVGPWDHGVAVAVAVAVDPVAHERAGAGGSGSAGGGRAGRLALHGVGEAPLVPARRAADVAGAGGVVEGDVVPPLPLEVLVQHGPCGFGVGRLFDFLLTPPRGFGSGPGVC
ncbi:hypothetical protein THAOC_06108, partial [Thalassiosira oceanica]